MSRLDRYLTIPFKPKGRSFDGADCWGLVFLFYKHELNVTLESYRDIDPRSQKEISELIDYHRKLWQPVTVAQEGDVIVMRTRVSSTTRVICGHVGVLVRIGGSSFGVLHTERNTNTRIDPVTSPLIASRVWDIRRYSHD